MCIRDSEYLYQILQYNNNNLPDEAKYCIRFHSLYLHHCDRAYDIFMNKKDHELLPLLKEFNKYDLYTKCDKIYDINEMTNKYLSLWKKYFQTNGLFL